MASLVEKYEKIFAADPRSRIFVELAKALVERGDHARAAEVCRQGLEHHPSSILGRVIWGRALLDAGDAKGAMDHFEIAIALEPSSPYAYNLVGEALLKKEMHREALPALARAAELQPADARVKGWLEEAKRRARGDGPAKPDGGAAGAATGSSGSSPAPAPSGDGAPAAPQQEGAAASGSSGTATDPATAGEAASASPPGAPTNGASQPPPLPPPPRKQAPSERSILQMIPGATRETKAPGPATRARIEAVNAPADPAEAARIAAQYERELREKLMSAPEPPPPFLHRHRRAVVAGAIAVAVGAAATVYLIVDARNAAVIAATAASRGRAGLARDTLGSLREAHRLLSEARRRSKADPEVASLAAQVAAVLAADYGDDAALEAARRLAADPAAGDGAVAAKWLLAERREKRKAEAAVLAARPTSAPLLQAIAGRILVTRGEEKSARGRLEIAARANPPLLRALSDLGDLELAGDDPDGALAVYGSALAAHATHARSAVGAAEARLLLGRDLADARKQLEAVEADPGSAPPRDLRARYEIAFARVLAATGDPGPAAARLTKAVEALGEASELADALAELHLAARAWDKAEAVAARAVKREPRDSGHRLLLARAQNGRGRFADALAATTGQDGRAFHVQRAIARYGLGQFRQARADLEKTARDGRMPADAAVWYALTDVALGRADRARSLLEKLTSAKNPPPLVHVALGRALEAQGHAEDAEAAYRAAAEREPNAPEGHAALGGFLVAQGRSADAVEPLERAAKLDPSNVPVRRSLGEARLASGQPAAARADFDFVLLATPRDASVLRLLSAAWLAEGQHAEARRAADQAALFAPRDPAALVAAARAALAAGDAADAKRYAARALKARAHGQDAIEARRIEAAAGKKR
jgi:Flp pilus assembly protein TadD